MEIRIKEFVSGAAEAEGITVIIDVFRAFTVACFAYDAGALRVIACGSPQSALDISKRYSNPVLAGEKDERKIAGFDIGNSPTEVLRTNVTGKVFIHSTTAGTNGLVNATRAQEVLTGSLVNASAVARYIKNKKPHLVTLVAMGYRAKESAAEDLLCAEIIKSDLLGENRNFTKEIETLRDGAGKRFFEPENLEFSPPSDYFLCIMMDKFNFVLRGERREDGCVDLLKIENI